MTVELFNSKQFEEALDHIGPYEKLGVVNGEFSYRVALDGQSALMIRSSVKANDLSAGSSRDSIRVWLVDNNDKPLASKTFQWVTRQPGWQDRLNERMLEIAKARELAGDCQKCQKPKGIYKTKQGKNKGKMFVKCFDCNAGFGWMDELKQSEVWFSEVSHGKVGSTKNSNSLQASNKSSVSSGELQQESRNSRLATNNLPKETGRSDSSGTDKQPSKLSDMQEVPRGNDSGGLAAFLAEADKLEPEPPKPDKKELVPSHYQSAIYDFVENSDQHGVVNGVAGCGKTTTNVQSLELLDPKLRIKYAAFNKHIEIDIKAKAPDHVDVQTFHGWGFRNIKQTFPKARFNQYKVYDIIDNMKLANGDYSLKTTITKLVSLLKGTLEEPTEQNIQHLADDFCLDIEPDQLIKVTRAFNASVANMKLVDFDDMVYFPAAGLVRCQPFDFIAVDEAQDMNMAQIRLATNSLADGSRMLIIGDPFQSIYAFRGAHVGIMDYMSEELNATSLPLSISYRAPLAIVELVNRKYPHIHFEAGPNAIPGSETNIDYEDFYEIVKDSHGVLCRTNAPLVRPCFHLIRQGIKATILGRNIGKGLLGLIKKREKLVRVIDLDGLLADIEIYRKNEIAKLERDGKLPRAALLDDQCKTIYALAEECRTIDDLKAKCKSVFSDERQGVVFSTVHKAKGLEWPTVHILEPGLMPHPMAQSMRDRLQEVNIAYVADTRTKNKLYYIGE